MDLLQYIKDKIPSKFPPENPKGNIEYKSCLKCVKSQKIEKLVTQMKWRLSQGYELYDQHIAFYVIGVHDNGTIAKLDNTILEQSVDILTIVGKKCNARVEPIYSYKNDSYSVYIIKITGEPDEEYYPLM
jgi:GTPase